ncbi:hypothetical protein SAMN05216490_4311 [Mucilaginibacter mallensis]|uniref:Uncharacterized protein n=1 Tax=Mucilaginibacter mallensis TaxID=652787 RepID=A0A1H2BS65_MUCMA|nr:hypothetical protein [Mucilaginibacter mallensis]SDT61003.1 hypothetical protein SAMN05216490_4311 [Mucilaginibacter mallensis]
MCDLVINIIFYALGIVLTTLPITIEFYLKKSQQIKKPNWYRCLIFIIVFCLFGLGVFKIVKDNDSQQSEISYKKTNKLKIDSLEKGIIHLTVSFNNSKDSTRKFQDSLLKDFGIIRNSKNMPVKKIFNNKMRDVGTLIEQ